MHKGEDVVGEAGGFAVVLFDAQVGLVVEQSIEHVGGITYAHINRLCVKEMWV